MGSSSTVGAGGDKAVSPARSLCVPQDKAGPTGAGGSHEASGPTGRLRWLLACGSGADAAYETPVPGGAGETWAMPGGACGVAGRWGQRTWPGEHPNPAGCCSASGGENPFSGVLRLSPNTPHLQIPKGLEMLGRATVMPGPCTAAGQDRPRVLLGYLTGETEAWHSCSVWHQPIRQQPAPPGW